MRYEFKTKLRAAEVMSRAREFFGQGAGGLGLDLTVDDACCITFVGGGGRVSVSATEQAGHTLVNIEATEWDLQAKQFLRKYAS